MRYANGKTAPSSGGRYSRGRAGPVSQNEIEITSVMHAGSGTSAYARGEGVLRKRDGTLVGVGFIVQGGNYAELRERLVRGETVHVPVRWTGSRAVTIVDEKTLEAYRREQGGRRAA